MKRRNLLTLTAASLAVGGFPSRLSSAKKDRQIDVYNAYQLLGQVRREAALQELTRAPDLIRQGFTHVAFMAEAGILGHMDASGRGPDQRARWQGYRGHVLGETLAKTQSSSEGAMTIWLTDPATQAVLMDPHARELGIAMMMDSQNQMWWVLTTGTQICRT